MEAGTGGVVLRQIRLQPHYRGASAAEPHRQTSHFLLVNLYFYIIYIFVTTLDNKTNPILKIVRI
jgi:hypothetical protein